MSDVYNLINSVVTDDLLSDFQNLIAKNDASALNNLYVKLIITNVYDKTLIPRISRIS